MLGLGWLMGLLRLSWLNDNGDGLVDFQGNTSSIDKSITNFTSAFVSIEEGIVRAFLRSRCYIGGCSS